MNESPFTATVRDGYRVRYGFVTFVFSVSWQWWFHADATFGWAGFGAEPWRYVVEVVKLL